MAMLHVLPNNLDDLIASRMFLCLYYHRMLHGGLHAVCCVGLCCVRGPITGSTIFKMLHGVIYCILFTDLLSAVSFCRSSVDYVPDCRHWQALCVWFTLPMEYRLWITSLRILLSHDEFIPSAMDYQHWSTVDLTLLRTAFPWWILSLPWIINCGLPQSAFLWWILCHESSTVEYLTAAYPW